MRIINLVEDTQGKNDCEFEHGLSLYIETARHKLLVDTGATDMFIRNATKLGIDLKAVDTIILSHGHYDHSGGIMPFSEINPNAKIYIRKTAGNDYYHGERYIGIDKSILSLPQIIFTDDYVEIDDELTLFSDITGRHLWAKSNLQLSQRINGKNIQDDFSHEQCLVVRCDGKIVLISGCAHNGILNILDKYVQIYKNTPDIVISGFHLAQRTEYCKEDIENIKNIANELKTMNTVFYSGHCTGKTAFDIMKEILQDKLIEIHSGDIII